MATGIITKIIQYQMKVFTEFCVEGMSLDLAVGLRLSRSDKRNNNIVTCIPIARQRLCKHIPATNAYATI
jgi:hypothetical protein